MLWLAGLMGLMAVSTAVYVDLGGEDPEDDTQIPNEKPAPDRLNLVLGNGQTDNINSSDETDAIANDLETVDDHVIATSSKDVGDITISDQSDAARSECVTQDTATITDFEPEDDSLVFVWDDSIEGHNPPKISVVNDPDTSGQLQVWMGEEIVAQVSGKSALITADIALIPLSSAIALNLETG